MTRAFVFPGQGSQALGMGRDLADAFPLAREVFQEIDDALSQNLSGIIWGDDMAALTLTENAQPALMAASVAAARVLADEGGFSLADKAAFVAGHSLGEYSALTAAGALQLADAARLLKLRGQAMQAAVAPGEGAMAALLGLDMAAAQEVAFEAAQGQVCQTANDNAPGQVVVSGHKAAVERAADIAKTKGAKRAVLLPVSAPFHCALMAPAAERMAEALADAQISAPNPAVVANVTAEATADPDEIRDLLTRQVTGTVRWRESVLWMGDQGVSELIELGAGKVLSGLTRRIRKDMTSQNAGTPVELEALLAKL